MSLEQDKIKDLFSSKLESFEPEVPASVWRGIESLLPKQAIPIVEPLIVSSASKSTPFISSRTIALLAGAAVIIAGAFFFTQDYIESPLLKIRCTAPSLEMKVKEAEPLVLNKDEVFSTVLANKPATREPVDVSSINSTSVVEEQLDSEVEQEVEQEENEVAELNSKKFRNKVVLMNESILETNLPSRKFSSRLSLGIVGNFDLLSGNITKKGEILSFSNNEMFNDVHPEFLENDVYELKHKQPISLGLTVSKKLSDRFSLETGLIYTYLSSSIKGGGVYSVDEKQTFHYLGVPLSLNYTFYRLGKADFYISLGGLIQKDVKGHYISDIRYSLRSFSDFKAASIEHTSNLDEKVKQDNPQFSVHGTLGVSYPIYKKLYIYGKLGGAYYFDAHNTYRTIYSDKDTQLELDLGIKFDF